MKLSTKQKQLLWLFAIALVYSLYLLTFDCKVSNDTASYFDAFTRLKSGQIDATRTPIYPIFVGVIDTLGGGYKTIAAVQYAIFIISVYFFYSLANIIVPNNKAAFVVSLIYVLSPQTAQWASTMMTESLNLSLTVIWLYFLAQVWVTRGKAASVIGYSLVLTLLLLLRPANIYLLAGCGILCLYWVRSKGLFMRVLTATAVPCIVLGIYCWAFNSQYGVFTPTRVSDVNKAVIMKLNHEHFDTRCIADTSLRKALDYYLREDTFVYEGIDRLQERYGIRTMNKCIADVINANKATYAKLALVRVTWMEADHDTLYYQPKASINALLVLLTLNGKEILLLTIIYALYLIWAYFAGARPQLSSILFVILTAAIVLSIVGAQSDYIRLCTSVIPILMLGYGQIASNIRVTSNRIL